jgi:hypothetical protein
LIIGDTGPLVAVANERDDHHAECTELLHWEQSMRAW